MLVKTVCSSASIPVSTRKPSRSMESSTRHRGISHLAVERVHAGLAHLLGLAPPQGHQARRAGRPAPGEQGAGSLMLAGVGVQQVGRQQGCPRPRLECRPPDRRRLAALASHGLGVFGSVSSGARASVADRGAPATGSARR